MRQPTGGRETRFLVTLARAPHLGKAGVGVLALAVAGTLVEQRLGAISLITAGFLAFAALTGTLFLLCLYDLAISVLRLGYRQPDGSKLPEPFEMASDVAQEYVRWLAPLGFVVGIIFGHYFWQ
ncbi:MAG TPA: hypothetical protein VJT78_12775 [Candidatus Dormibacteraeota bacterium]|nr:hypothetical protein [Candidatus Dormibacteraeota bacterium]